jgi:hypothetical protein
MNWGNCYHTFSSHFSCTLTWPHTWILRRLRKLEGFCSGFEKTIMLGRAPFSTPYSNNDFNESNPKSNIISIRALIRNLILTLIQTLKSKGGLMGFYSGFGITIMREIPFSLVQFPLYEYAKVLYCFGLEHMFHLGWGFISGRVGLE